MSFGWFLDGLDSASAGCSVLDTFFVAAGEAVSKSYATDVLKFAKQISVSIVPYDVITEHALYNYPSLVALLNSAVGTATISGSGGSLTFMVVVFVQ